ncbi:MAG: hypothetical protein KAS32_15255, partial [Candidatus Peribacteraceae bacterium]|nr:hypothetical protein [Candidatus Peribacteraceae bacterium]
KATLSGVVFSVNATNVSIAATSFKVYNKTASSDANKVTCTAYNGTTAIVGTASGVVKVDCRGLFSSTSIDTAIDQGDDLTLVLEANITNTNNSTVGSASNLQVSIQQFNTIARSTYGVATTSGISNLEWVDDDSGITQEFTWVESLDTSVKSTAYTG